MVAPMLTSVEDALSVLSSGYGVPDPYGTGLDVLTRSLITAQRAAGLRSLDAEFQVAALLLDIGRLLDPNHRDPGGLGATATRELFGRRVADLVRLHPRALAFRSMIRGDTNDGADLSLPLSPSALRRLRRHRCSGDAVALAVLVEELDPTESAPPLLSWRPLLDCVADATARERELSLLSLQLMAIPR